MTAHQAPGPVKVAVRDRETGELFYRWSVDASEAVATHPDKYELATDVAPVPAAATDPPPPSAPR